MWIYVYKDIISKYKELKVQNTIVQSNSTIFAVVHERSGKSNYSRLYFLQKRWQGITIASPHNIKLLFFRSN